MSEDHCPQNEKQDGIIKAKPNHETIQRRCVSKINPRPKHQRGGKSEFPDYNFRSDRRGFERRSQQQRRGFVSTRSLFRPTHGASTAATVDRLTLIMIMTTSENLIRLGPQHGPTRLQKSSDCCEIQVVRLS